MTMEALETLRRDGHIILRHWLPPALVASVRQQLDQSLRFYQNKHQELGYTADAQGGAHHVLAQGGAFIDIVGEIAKLRWLGDYLHSKLIINSFGGFDNQRERKLYVCNVHRDIRFFFADRPLMLNLLVMIDDFRLDNGATHLLTGSHRQEEKPEDTDFFAHASRATGSAGDLLIFDSRLWHAAGTNQTEQHRRALTITLTSPYIKPQFDYCRALGDEQCSRFSDDIKQLLGYFARIPASLEEWYQPAGKRFYRGDQDHVA